MNPSQAATVGAELDRINARLDAMQHSLDRAVSWMTTGAISIVVLAVVVGVVLALKIIMFHRNMTALAAITGLVETTVGLLRATKANTMQAKTAAAAASEAADRSAAAMERVAETHTPAHGTEWKPGDPDRRHPRQ